MLRLEQKKLYDVFYRAGAIGEGFNLLPLINNEWFSTVHDLEYFLGYSGNKFASPFLLNLLRYEGTDIVTPAIRVQIAEVIKSKFETKWNILYTNIFNNEEYQPLNNYNIKQVETPDMVYTKNETTKFMNTRSITDSTDDGIYGFNSSTASLSDTTTKTSTITDTQDPDDNLVEEERKENGTRTTERSGINGNNTQQELAMKEIELRKHNFYDIVYQDLDTVLCLSIY